MTVSTAIFCLAAVIDDAVNKAVVKSAKYPMSQHFLLFLGKEKTDMAIHPEGLKFKAKESTSIV